MWSLESGLRGAAGAGAIKRTAEKAAKAPALARRVVTEAAARAVHALGAAVGAHDVGARRALDCKGGKEGRSA